MLQFTNPIGNFVILKETLPVSVSLSSPNINLYLVSDVETNRSPLENSNSSILPKAVAKKLIQQIAKETKLSSNNFKITEVKPAEFNSTHDSLLNLHQS